MNILVATQRQSTLEANWALLGTQYLFGSQYNGPINWVTYDLDSNAYEETLANQFHHQTLLPFDAVVFTGVRNWRGKKMQPIYSLLAKSQVPLFALGLGLEEDFQALSDLEISVLSRPDTLIVAKDHPTKDYFSRYQLLSNVLPCPSIFSGETHVRNKTEDVITFVLSDNIHNQKEELTIAPVLESLMDLSANYPLEILTTSTNSFMRFSTMFRNKVRYSYNSQDYLPWFERSKLVIATDLASAAITTALGTNALLINDLLSISEQSQLKQYPHIQAVNSTEISKSVENQLKTTVTSTSGIQWKEHSHENWKQVLSRKELQEKR